MSFICARDPSILAGNAFAGIRMNLYSKFEDTSTISEDEKNVQLPVFLRIKPNDTFCDLYKTVNNKFLFCKVPSESHFFKNVRNNSNIQKKYSFTKIYTSEISQRELFDDCMKAKVLDFLNGKNCSVFAYGISGSGKTYTILGNANHPGIVPRVLEYIFRTLPQLTSHPNVELTSSGGVNFLDKLTKKTSIGAKTLLQNLSDKQSHIHTYKNMQERLTRESVAVLSEKIDVSVSVWISFAEVYNEYIYDLLTPAVPRGKQRTKLRLGQDRNGQAYIKDLTCINVRSGLEAYLLLQYGMNSLNYATTNINNHSSRSHCIFTIKLLQVSESKTEVRCSHFNLCDLAGSERTKLTGNVGVRLKESNNINTSLHVLGRCIKTIRESQANDVDVSRTFIPFRESKFTQLFQRALAGHEYIAMIVNVNTCRELFDENQHVLNFSAIARDILIDANSAPNNVQVNKRFSQYVQSINANTQLSSVADNSFEATEERITSILKDHELKIREELTEYYENWMNRLKENFKAQLQEERNLNKQLTERCDDIQAFYVKRQRLSVVDLTDDDKEDLQNEYNVKCTELEVLKTENDNLKSKLQQRDAKIMDLESLLTDGVQEYRELNEQNLNLKQQLEDKICEVFNLRKDIEDLKPQLTSHALEQVRQAEYIEQLEESACK